MAILFVCTTLTIAAQKKSSATAPTGPSVFSQDKGKFTIQLDGNVATATFDALVSADNSLLSVEASVLTSQDELSLSTITTTAAVG